MALPKPMALIVAVRCFIDAIFGHSLGPGVSTRAGRDRSSPQLFRGAPGLVLPVTRAIAWGDPANCTFARFHLVNATCETPPTAMTQSTPPIPGFNEENAVVAG